MEKYLNIDLDKKSKNSNSEYFKEAMERSFEKYAKDRKYKSKKQNIALIGLGPHAKRIYLNYFKKHKTNFALLVDLESKRNWAREYLDEQGFKSTKIFTLADSLKDKELLPKDVESNLLAVCKTLEISHIIIATEPKAHNMYIHFALENNYDVLTDKPITVTKNMTSLRSIEKVRNQYYDILKLANNTDVMCKVMCQRQYHRGYEYIKNLLNETIKKYQIPITYIDIYHSDGNWEMPHDMLKENHPYKYGYGKLFHSGYHFIDLLSDFVKLNNQLKGNKKIEKAEVYSSALIPNDELNIFNKEDFLRIFKDQQIPEYYYQEELPKFDKFGEKNYYGSINFRNRHNQLITHVNLNLLHYGFSRRGWIESRDYYKSNGRIRHEYINIQVGPLMSIQVHSYQSKEIKDRTNDVKLEEEIGGLEHFDIHIYRNCDLIGGKAHEVIRLGDLYTEKEKKNILGYNELSREVYINNFLKGKCEKGDIKDQALGIEILTGCAKGIHNYYENKRVPVNIEVRNDYTYPINLSEYKQYSNKSYINKERNDIDGYSMFKDEYDLHIFFQKVLDSGEYLTFLSIADNKNAAGGLLQKTYKNKILAKLRYNYLKILIKYFKVNSILKMIEKQGNKRG